ncbi:MAG: hypothetical protein AAFR47_16530 [Pseudomonadota bacterium]
MDTTDFPEATHARRSARAERDTPPEPGLAASRRGLTAQAVRSFDPNIAAATPAAAASGSFA